MRALTRWLFMAPIMLGLPAGAFAQGSIGGVVKDGSGAVLPGVTVEAASPALIEKVRSVVTDGSGQYRIVDLRPGAYRVTFTLTGFSTVVREGVVLAGSFAATVNADLKVGAVTETVTVTAESPIVDVQSVSQQRVLDREVLDAIPTGRGLFDDAVLVPGITGSNPGITGNLMDVGGTNNLQLTVLTIHGGRSSDMRVLIDGLSIGNVSGAGQYSNFVPDSNSTQEVAIDYAAGSAELLTGGPTINLIPRDGGNTFHGSFFGTGVNSSFQGNNYTTALRAAGLSAPNALFREYDINPGGGGPILRDTLWFYSSLRWQANENYVAGDYYNLNAGNPNAWSYLPDLSRQAIFSIIQPDQNTRLTWQANQKNKFTLFYEHQSRTWQDILPNISPESATQYRFPQDSMLTAGWSSPLNNRVLLEARVSHKAEHFFDVYPAAGDVYRTLIPVTEQSTGLLYRGGGNGQPGPAQPYINLSMPDIISTMASLSYVTGTHAFKIGVVDAWGSRYTSYNQNDAGLSYRFNNGIPNQITEYATPYSTVDTLKAELGIYAQDKWTLKKFTVNTGLRFDYYDTAFPAQYLGSGTIVPTRNLLLAPTPYYSWKDLSPRLGVVYDVSGTGKTALKASFAKYVLAGNPTNGNPASNLTTSVTRSWNDTTPLGSPDYYIPQCNLLNPSQNGSCGTISDLTFGGVKPSTTFDPKTLAGWNVRPGNWEFSTSIQHQLLPRVGVNLGYFRRWYDNFTTTDNLAVAPSDYSPFSITAPTDPRLPAGGAEVVGGFYNLNPNRVGAVNNYVTFADNFGSQIEHWNGIDASVNARLRGGLLVQGGLSTGRTTTDSCGIVSTYLSTVTLSNSIGAVQSTQMCHLQTPFLTQLKLLGTYTVPTIGLRAAATFQSYPGPAILANYVATNSLVQPSLGRPLSGGAQNVTLNVVAPGTLYGDRANQVDLRLTKLLPLGRTRTAVNVDLYNALNANTVTALNNNFASWQTPQAIQQARLFKLSIQFDF